jgi:hypothetical protein
MRIIPVQVSIGVQTKVTFFEKVKNPKKPLMGATLNSKTHLQNTFFRYFDHFVRVLLQNIQNVMI